MDDDLAFERVILVNSGLAELCKTYSAKFIDNITSFMLHSGCVNNAYFQPRGLHLLKGGTKCLLDSIAYTTALIYKDHRRIMKK